MHLPMLMLVYHHHHHQPQVVSWLFYLVALNLLYHPSDLHLVQETEVYVYQWHVAPFLHNVK